MKGGSILHRLRQLSISSSLRGAFLTGALLTLKRKLRQFVLLA